MPTSVRVVRDAPTLGRKLRGPKHTFAIDHKPWQIQPFMIAPVLPGETMKNLLVQATIRSDALKSEQLGWWYEQYFFYIKHRDLPDRDTITAMHLDPSGAVSAEMAALRSVNGDGRAYTYAGAVNWTRLCLDAVVAEYFRDEGEDVMTAAIDGLPLATINSESWLQSAKSENDVREMDTDNLPGDFGALGMGAAEAIAMGDVQQQFGPAYAQWEQMRALKLYDSTFEDYLRSFGVKPPREVKAEEIHRPELVRYIRDWQYPVVKFDVDTGTAAPQMQWNISERADKDRFFQEPGFLFGVAVWRPKIYLGKQRGSAVGLMDTAFSWLPAVLQEHAYTSLVKAEANQGPLEPGDNAAYWVDIRDLMVHGDQFVASSVAPPGTIASPSFVGPNGSEKLETRFGSAADYASLFADVAKCRIFADGVVSLSIASRITDTSL